MAGPRVAVLEAPSQFSQYSSARRGLLLWIPPGLSVGPSEEAACPADFASAVLAVPAIAGEASARVRSTSKRERAITESPFVALTG
jgi:hypothetical protein